VSETTVTRRPWWRRKSLMIPLCLFLVVGAAYVSVRVHWRTTHKFFVVHDGRLYRSAEIPHAELIEVCRDHGIRTVFDFREQHPDENHVTAEAEALQRAGIRHVHLPSGQVPPLENVDAFLEMMDDPATHPALIHCTHGNGRTGVYAAIYRREYQGWSDERSRLEARLLGGLTSFGPNNNKGAFLIDYVPRAER